MNSEDKIEYASFGMRLGAFLIDIVILILALFYIMPKIFRLIRESSFTIDKETGFVFIIVGVLLYFVGVPLLGVFCRALFECSKLQGTPGKAILEIQVVDLNFQRISFKKSFLRNFVKHFSGLLFGIGYLVALGNNKCLTWHDMAAKTQVIRRIKTKNLIKD
ncbi:RDD family protein [Flagellimonas sp.]|uniref:RDD family protein n=1 Tax=Flagellimonas sp. TaxID=2058762 RepID=UPI003BAD430B